MWIKGKALALLVGIYINTAIMENIMDIALKNEKNHYMTQKSHNNTYIYIYPEKSIIQKDTCTPIFFAHYSH